MIQVVGTSVKILMLNLIVKLYWESWGGIDEIKEGFWKIHFSTVRQSFWEQGGS